MTVPFPITLFRTITDLPTIPGTLLTGTEVVWAVYAPTVNGQTRHVQLELNQIPQAFANSLVGCPLIVGSPQGTVTAPGGALRFDTLGQALWINLTSSGSNGWLQLI